MIRHCYEAMEHPGHIPVLLAEVMELLQPQEGETALDGTLGCGGHAAAIAGRLGPDGCLVGIDQDESALSKAEFQLRESKCRLHLVCASFRDADDVLEELECGPIDIALLDLGFSSPQVDSPERGFSFKQNGPLDMRMDRSQGTTAADLLNTASENELAQILKQYGEERQARRIARVVCERRKSKPVSTTEELKDIVYSVLGSRPKAGIDPATRTFQALRIAINDELSALEEGLHAIWGHLAQDGRFAVISYHSLEDRIVKHFFREREGRVDAPPGLPVPPPVKSDGQSITRKPIRPGMDELEINPRARSAKLRAIRKTAANE